MNRFMTILVICIAVLMTSSSTKAMGDENETAIENNSAATSNEENNGYCLKSVKDTIPGNESKGMIYFISPEGEVFKKLDEGICPDKGDGTVISKNGKYALYSKTVSYESKGEGSSPIGDVIYQIEYYNAKGEMQFEKKYQLYFEDYADFHTKAISEDGERILIYYATRRTEAEDTDTSFTDYNRRDLVFHLDIMDKVGRNICSKIIPPVTDRQFSRDGKLFGGVTYKDIDGEWVKHLYFLNTDTGEWKLCKAEGIIDSKKWSARFLLSNLTDPNLLTSGQVWISVSINPQLKWSGRLYFNEIPKDLAKLFNMR